MASTFFRAPQEPTIIRRPSPNRLPLPQTFQGIDLLPPHDEEQTSLRTINSSLESTSNSIARSSPAKDPNNSTGATSLDSRYYGSSPVMMPKDTTAMVSERRQQLLHQQGTGTTRCNTCSSPDSNLATIQETAMDQSSPSVLTVERAAAAKIYLETYYNEVLTPGPSPRDVRLRQLEKELFDRGGGEAFTSTELATIHQNFCRRETEHLRETRAIKTRTMRAMAARSGSPDVSLSQDYEVIKTLGKGSFGVVRLVQEKVCFKQASYSPDAWLGRERRQVYAMKVIRKTAMLKTSQEAHLRAERDFLVASEGSRWIVPLVASFEDISNLYLVMEYMPGGDFLGLLIRENILHESVARFYVAEMIVCVEAAHALKCIHRDIKPDNFLISASGHLKIADFGLAFDGHWSHDTSYYSSHRYSLLKKLGIRVEGDDKDKEEARSLQATAKTASKLMTGMERHEKKEDNLEPLLNWRNRCGNRTSAMSVVGTSQYMAPEGRQMTKQNIIKHKETFGFPSRPQVSHRCQHLIASLIQDKENRLCSKRYHVKDLLTSSASRPGQSSAVNLNVNNARSRQRQQQFSPRDLAGCYVFPNDAEDIKAHKWFRSIPWDHLHEIQPPFVPDLSGQDDTRYFDDDEDISDWSESESSERNYQNDDCGHGDPENASTPLDSSTCPPSTSRRPPPVPDHINVATEEATEGRRAAGISQQKEQEARLALRGFWPSIQNWALDAISKPYDSNGLRELDAKIDGIPDLQIADRYMLKQFLRVFGRKERKRARDRLLRDRKTKGLVMEERKKTAFIRYAWRRIRPTAVGCMMGMVNYFLVTLWQRVSKACGETCPIGMVGFAVGGIKLYPSGQCRGDK
ncbi:serine/threonine-protein kinase [Naviculisporaceae sp. PSN 640]